MFHPDTQFLIDHWTGLSRHESVRAGIPDRAALEPAAMGLRLPRVFIAGRSDGDHDAVIRLAGAWIEGFHGEPLKDHALLSVWRSASRPLVAAALTQTVREARPVVIAALAGVLSAQIEVTLAPLRGPSGAVDRILGLYAPMATLSLSAEEPRLLTARVSIGVGVAARPPLALAAVGGRRIA
ncbi:MAG: PAS domain-containing protein [Brevundimonas sp.]|uniref:PAS domain-containing protein n=1 Tax=Brevundimonas sp. TaxID=1871086 RepID=UPI0027254DAE|nr:PAS domain-containing protein [Brevundimonas sp.]MDO9588589.1 PAS domain-containing protein [Brevundimonas sp.]MDP3369593.1 PAS domain-containing protein [Brevundimonas sp.]